MFTVRTTLLVIGLAVFAFNCSCSGSAPSSVASSAYENKLVRRPGTTAEDGKVYVVQNGRKHWIINASWCAAHGFKFPDDVHVISSAELDAIPMGDAIE